MVKNEECVKVVVRCRPLSEKEVQEGRQRIIEMDCQRGEVSILNPKGTPTDPPKNFTFDQVYDWNSKQQDLYRVTASPIVDSVLEGYNGTIFAYGQTGTGKSFTMEGKDDPEELRGIIPNSFNHIFGAISRDSGKQEYLVRASYLEIYNEEIRDLLAKDPHKRMDLKESVDRGVYVRDLMQFVVKNVAEINSVLQVGKKNRSVGATLMNQDSSRSHSIFTITIEGTTQLANGGGGEGDDNHIRVGKLNLVDLAGSERQSKTGATGDRLKEATKINLSLSALGNVISALVDGKSGHIPYRDSKLTRLLQDSLGGNTKTVMVANLGPADYNFDESLSTLRYANRAKNIKNKPHINEDPKDAMLREFQEEIARLRSALDGKGGGRKVSEKVVEKVVEKDASEAKVAQIKKQMRDELEENLRKSMSESARQQALKEAEARAAAQLKAIAEEAGSTQEERAQAEAALLAQHQEIQKLSEQMQKEQKEQEELSKKIKAMESKVLVGGENLLEKAELLEAEAQEAEKRLEAQKAQETAAAQRIKELEEEKMDLNKKYGSIEEEIAEKTKRIKKLYSNYQAKKHEVKDIQDEFQREREDILEQMRQLSQQMKLKDLIISNFIPDEYQQKIMEHCQWREYDETWIINGIEHAGNYVQARKEKELAQQKDRDTEDNDFAFDMDGVVKVGESPALANVYFSYKALDEELYTADGYPLGRTVGGGRPGSARKSRPKSGRPPSARKSKNATDVGSLRDSVADLSDDAARAKEKAAYPEARGLVSRGKAR
uniref:Kinesin-like protein n=1 Tax=Tetraselmis sp. GSL018 TaxID=582737 RepID=A0A061S6B5_9CHLO|mmetsp:Transcript_1592/g.3641  ORF Transcript_1592/g.3641 Transcript_1592/m.3641 type:complete len:776 (+) Transcript_1592:496-2823(+)